MMLVRTLGVFQIVQVQKSDGFVTGRLQMSAPLFAGMEELYHQSNVTMDLQTIMLLIQ